MTARTFTALNHTSKVQLTVIDGQIVTKRGMVVAHASCEGWRAQDPQADPSDFHRGLYLVRQDQLGTSSSTRPHSAELKDFRETTPSLPGAWIGVRWELIREGMTIPEAMWQACDLPQRRAGVPRPSWPDFEAALLSQGWRWGWTTRGRLYR